MSFDSRQFTHLECDDVSRRSFLKTASGAALAASGSVWAGGIALGEDKPSTQATDETLVGQFFQTLTEDQKKVMAFSFDHPLRQQVDNNWHITEAVIGETFTKDQQAMLLDIFRGLHSEQYADIVMKQVEHDNRNTNRKGGFGGCTVAVFGAPGTGKFELVFTGRHMTRRCDGDSVEGAAFGGPIFYGHAAEGFNEKPDHPGNVYWYQAKRANELFQALDGKQRQLALRDDPRPEQQAKTVAFHSSDAPLPGVPASELTGDQQELARKVIADVLAPFRKKDVEECMKMVDAQFADLHFTYYKNMDIGGDGVWDVWQIEGPSMVWYFRGSPHVHTWVNLRQPDGDRG